MKRSLISKSMMAYVQTEVELKQRVLDHSSLPSVREWTVEWIVGCVSRAADAVGASSDAPGAAIDCEPSGRDVSIGGYRCRMRCPSRIPVPSLVRISKRGPLPMSTGRFAERGMEVVAVDNDDEVLEIGKCWFDFVEKPGQLNIVCDDGRAFLAGEPRHHYDALFIDVAAPSTENAAAEDVRAPPEDFYSAEAAEVFRAKLKSHGVLVINVIGGWIKLKEIASALRPCFAHVEAVHIPQSTLLFAWKTQQPHSSYLRHLAVHDTDALPLLKSLIEEIAPIVDAYHDRYANRRRLGWIDRESLSAFSS